MTEVVETAAYFESFYQGESPFEGMTFKTVPWDIGQAQRFIVEAERAGRIWGDIADVGCGLGNNVIYLAERGHSVTGIDIAPTAIKHARKRAEMGGVEAEFVVGNAITLEGFDNRFDTLIDSGLIECLDEPQRREYAASLYRASRPGAQLNIFCVVAEKLPVEIPGINGFTKEELHEILAAAGWTVTDVRDETYLCNTYAGDFFRSVGVEVDTDAAGRVKLASWAVEAERE